MENNIRTEFEKYMDNEISDWEIVLDATTINKLKEIYNELEKNINISSTKTSYILSIIDPIYPLSCAAAQLKVEGLEQKLSEMMKTIKNSLGKQKKI